MSKPAVLVVDDEPDLCELLSITLQRMDLNPHTAGSVGEAQHMLKAERYDLCLTDMQLPDGNGIDVCRDLLALVPALKCLIYSGHGDRQTLIEAVLAGASGFLLKNSTESDLLAAIRRVAAGEAVLDRTLAPYGVAERGVGTSNGPPFGRLTAQEARVVALVAKGSSNLQIAEALCLSEKTVKNYLSRVLSKTGFANRTQLAVWVTHQVDGV